MDKEKRGRESEMQSWNLKAIIIAKTKRIYDAKREDVDSAATDGVGFVRVLAKAIKRIASKADDSGENKKSK